MQRTHGADTVPKGQVHTRIQLPCRPRIRKELSPLCACTGRKEVGPCSYFEYLFLLTQFHSESNILASLARLGYPGANPPPTKQPLKLKTVAKSLIFMARMKRAAALWKEQRAARPKVAAALEEVRKRRQIEGRALTAS